MAAQSKILEAHELIGRISTQDLIDREYLYFSGPLGENDVLGDHAPEWLLIKQDAWTVREGFYVVMNGDDFLRHAIGGPYGTHKEAEQWQRK